MVAQERSRKRTVSRKNDIQNRGPTVPVEEIARRAHEIFLARGGEDGRDVEDWLRAERELRERAARQNVQR